MIESSSNSQFKKIQKLKKNVRFRRSEGCFVAEGWKMTEEALQRGMVRTLYVSASAMETTSFSQQDVPVEVVSDKLFRELSDTVTPQGVLAVVSMPEYRREDMICSDEAALLCLENIQDPGNLGTMVRTAEGAGMSGVVLSSGCVDLFNPKVVRSTMGALFRVPFYVCEDITTEVESLKKDGFSIYAAHLEGTADYTEEEYSGRVGILIGNEANGLSDSLSELADKKVKIPMEGQLESLNAAVSAALFMYEVHRKRK
jgi:TrmH family RNA methyltransferase